MHFVIHMTKENTKDRTRATIELSRPLMAVDIDNIFFLLWWCWSSKRVHQSRPWDEPNWPLLGMHSQPTTFGSYLHLRHRFWEYSFTLVTTKGGRASERCYSRIKHVAQVYLARLATRLTINLQQKKIVAQHSKHEDCTAPVLHRRSLV